MTCREFTDFIQDYLTGNLAPDARARFERHLTRCPQCPEYLRQYERTIMAGRLAFDRLDDPVSSEVPEDLVAAILAATR